MQRIHLRAAMCIEVTVRVVSAGVIGGAVPRVATAGRLRHGGVYRIVYRQMQRVHLRATMRIEVTVRVVSAGGVGGAVPRVITAGRLRHGSVHRIIHRQIHRQNAVIAQLRWDSNHV